MGEVEWRGSFPGPWEGGGTHLLSGVPVVVVVRLESRVHEGAIARLGEKGGGGRCL